MRSPTESKHRDHLSARNVLANTAKVLSHGPYIRPLALFQLEKQFFNRFYRSREEGRANRVRQLSMRITDNCNLRCHTCGQWGDNGYLHDKSLAQLHKSELPKERYIELLRDLKANGHRPILYFWGGEPMLYGGLMDIIEEGARLGMPPTLGTNGTLLAKQAERLVDAPMFMVQVSVDGANREVHNAARPGRSAATNNFEDVVAGLERLREVREKRGSRLPLLVSITVVSKENAGHLVEIYDRLKGLTDLQIYCLAFWIDKENAQAQAADFARRFGEPSTLQFAWIGDWHTVDYGVLSEELKRLKQRASGWKDPPVHVVPDLGAVDELREFYTNHQARFGFDDCISISQVVEVNSNGDLSPCREYHDYVVGNVREHTVSELWNSERYVAFRKSLFNDGLMPVCSRCCGLMGY